MAEFLKATNALTSEMKLSSAIKQRRIFLSDEISRESLFEISYYLYKLQDIDRRTNTKEPIEIVINSFGGSAYDYSMVVSQIEQMKDDGYKIITVTSGYSMSAAVPISMCGSERRAYRRARYLVHTVSSGTWGKLQQMQDDVEETNYLWEQYKDIIKTYSKITEEQLEYYKERSKDWSFSVSEALELGVIDKIL